MIGFRQLFPCLIAFVLVVALVLGSDITVGQFSRAIANISLISILGVIASGAGFVYLSNVKWLMAMERVAPEEVAGISRGTAFYYTALGTALSLVVTPHLSMILARSLGAKFEFGHATGKSAGVTVYEQLFDLVPILAAALAALCVIGANSGIGTWLALTAVFAVLGGIGMIMLLRSAERLAVLSRIIPWRLRSRMSSKLEWTERPEMRALLNESFVLKIYAISILRYAVLMLRSWFILLSASMALSTLHFAEAYSFVRAAGLIGITPGGLGISEWTWAGVLTWLGYPINGAVEFAFANRILNTASMVIVFLASLVFVRATARPTATTVTA